MSEAFAHERTALLKISSWSYEIRAWELGRWRVGLSERVENANDKH